MSLGQAIVILIRLVVPLSIFRWPLAGGLAAMLVDALDVVLIEAIGHGGFSHYTALDNAKLRAAGLADLPDWRSSLEAYFHDTHGMVN